MIVKKQGSNPLFGIIILLFLIMMIWMAITAVKGIFLILSWLALPLFIMAVVLNYQVVTGYFKWLWKLLREDTIKGIIYSGLSLVGYPVVSAYLAFKAFMNNRWTSKETVNESKGRYIKYNEVKVEEDDEDFLELPEIESLKEDKSEGKDGSKYDDMF